MNSYWLYQPCKCVNVHNSDITSIPPVVHSFYINCGGPTFGEYEADQSAAGTSYFRSSRTSSVYWAYSSTGNYMDRYPDKYTVTTAFSSNESYPEIFQTARIAPLSLKYYGLCLRKGSYKVTLHFAEIMFSDNQTFSSLGRRIFDVSIQVSKSRILIIIIFLTFTLLLFF